MSKTFEKLLITKEILSKEKLEYYRCLQAQEGKKHLGEILFFEGILKKQQLDELLKIEFEHEVRRKQKHKKRKDKMLLQEVKSIGFITKKDINACKLKKENEFCCEIFVKKGYITPYMIRKLLRKKASKYEFPENLVIDITQYQKDRFLGQIAVKNEFVSEQQLLECWKEVKQGWPKKKLIDIFLEKKFFGEKNAQKITKVLEKTISKRYLFYKYQRKDVALGRKIVADRYLSPWRINKCLLKQVNIIRKQKKYTSLEQITIDDGYLTEYFFREILYGENDGNSEVTAIDKEDIPQIIKDAVSDVHLILDNDDVDDLHLQEKNMEDIEEIEEIDEEGLESIANFTRNHLGVTASQTIHMSEDDLQIFDDEESQAVDITLVVDSEEEDDDFDFVIGKEDIGD